MAFSSGRVPASRVVWGLVLLVGIALIAITPAPIAAAQRAGQPVVIGNDRGGLLNDRLRQISALRQTGRRVEIRGKICFSTCTMLIGLPNACILPDTVFGFHGPSSYGRPLDAQTFERASRIIARYYPAPLKRWYLETGRKTVRGLRRIKGAELIRMGVPRC